MPTFSESDSRDVVAAAGVVVSDWAVAPDPAGAASEASRMGFPVAAKLCGAGIAHKTERGLVRLGLAGASEVESAAEELLAVATPEDGRVEVLVSTMLSGNRELIAGLVRDDSFGPCVMLGIGGVLAEAVADVAFRLAPLDRADAHDLIASLATQALLGPFRGEPAVDREALADTLCALGSLAGDETIRSVDLNPLIISDGRPVAVDALVELAETT
ncbi:MAG: carboxylate--amine ligase [Acidimicrobiaceae bacterium]|nr:carboxylate--amine ligase [Acidimicrobiaceae bacterium]